MRQGLLSEPEASSGPAAMLLAVSRSPSSIPRRSPCPERCHLSLASLNHIHLSKPQKHPQLHPLPEQCHLPLASLDHIPPNETSNVSPPASNAKSRRQKNLSHRHETPTFSFQVFRKKIKCIILIDKRIKTSASVYGKYHTKGGFYHGIQTFRKHDLSSS